MLLAERRSFDALLVYENAVNAQADDAAPTGPGTALGPRLLAPAGGER